jgi:hypothetical protein
MKKVYSFLKIFTVLLVLVLTTSIINAQKTAIADGNWDAAATWQGGVPPVLADDVTISNGVTVTLNVGNAQCASVNIAAGNDDGGITFLNNSSSLSVTNGVTINASTGNNKIKSVAVDAGTFSCGSLTLADVTVGNPNTDVILSVSTGTVTVSGNVLMSGSTTENFINITGAGRLNLGGSISTATGALSAASGSTVDYNGGGAQTVRPIIYSNLILSGSGAKTITGSTINGTLSRQGTATAAGTSPTYGAAAILEYKGSVAQTISDVEFGGTGANPANVTIDNANGVTLSTAKSIDGVLSLVNGYLTTTGLLTINAAGNATTANGAFVNGPLAKAKNTTTLFTFPVGNLTGGLRTIGVTPETTAGATYNASFLSANPRAVPNGTNLGAVAQISACEYWDLAQTTGTTPARVTVSWPAAANSCGHGAYVGDLPTLIVAHHNGANWINEGQSAATGDAVNGGTITSANFVGTFSPFVLGTTDASLNPLPVLFADVKAYEKNNGVQIEWSNLTERDLVNYVVERSANGQSFTGISEQLPRSNQNDKESYTSFDASPLAGANFYRIKVQEISGKIIYSKILKVTIGVAAKGFTLYPNPVKGNQVTVGINAKQGQYTLTVMSTGGQKVFIQKIIHQGGNMSQAIELPATVKPGAYNMTISGDNYREAKMFIVQ